MYTNTTHIKLMNLGKYVLRKNESSHSMIQTKSIIFIQLSLNIL